MERGLKHSPQNISEQRTTATNKIALDNIAETEEQNHEHSDVKLVEARTAILLLKNRAITTRTEPTMWILENMFRPLLTRDHNDYQLLLLSAAVKPAWERKRKQPQPQAEGGYFSPPQVISPENEGTPTPPIMSYMSSQNTVPNNDRIYVLTPRTRILTVTKEHNMVFMVDLSSSLATIETSTGKVMIGSVFYVLENIINGLVKPFSLNTSDNSPPIVMEYIIRITVIVECSQFGSNMNVIPILAEYPTIRVLMQNVHVSVNNVNSVLSDLKGLIDEFKKDLGKFRKKLTMKRSKMGYELDVRENHAQSVAESAESNFTSALDSPTKFSAQSRKGSLSTNASVTKSISLRHSRNKSITLSKQQHGKKSETTTSSSKKSASNHHHHRHHSHHHRYNSSNTSNSGTSQTIAGPTRRSITKDKKDVWGVGKTGSSLSYILRSGLFALNLLPKDGQSSLILLTDGVVKSNIQDESVIRQLTTENIACNVIQIGQHKSFFPGLNFGFVPDNEVLEFLTSATHGVFAYADDCPPIISEELTTDIFSSPPNIYHHRYMLNEIHLDHFSRRKIKENATQKSKPSAENDGSSTAETTTSVSNSSAGIGGASVILGMPHIGTRVFPWDPISKPIVEDVVRLKFKEYFLPNECWHFMRARLRQGFVLHSISFADEPKPMGANKSTGLNKQVSEGLPNFQTKQNVLIVFILRWQPSITVQYTIKALWTSSLWYYLKTIAQERMVHIPEDPQAIDTNDNIFNCMRAPKAEIIIKSTSTFSHMLHNWDQIQRRNQMMAVQGSNATIDLIGAPGFIKVGKMKRLLERLAEADSMLKQLVQFNLSDKSHIAVQQQFDSNGFDSNANNSNAEWTAQLNYIQKFSSHWSKLERSDLRFFNMCWYDESYFNLILVGNNTVSRDPTMDYQIDLQQQNNQVILMGDNDNNIIQIHGRLERWSTFMSEDHQVYIKLLNIGETMHALKTTHSPNANSKRPTSSASYAYTRKHVVPQFCEVRVIRETDCVLCVKLMFFNANTCQRQGIIEELQTLFNAYQQNPLVQTLTALEVKSVPSTIVRGIEDNEYNLELINIPVKVTKRPLSSLLIRDDSHFLPTTNNKSSDLEIAKYNATADTNKAPWYVNPAMILTGEFIVRNYLYQYTWHWDTQDIPNDKQPYGRYFVPVQNLAFDHIAVVRLEQGWNVISANKCFAHFYKEVSCTNNDSIESTYSVQYFIWKDIQKKRISTELWLEPLSNESTLKLYDIVKAEIFERDKQILSQLITFDIVHLFGQNSSISEVTDTLKDQMEVEDEARGTVKWMQRASVFNLSSVLRLGSFLFALYPCPNYSRHFHPENSSSDTVTIEYPYPQQEKPQEKPQEQQEQSRQSSLTGDILDTSMNYNRRRTNASVVNAVGSRSRTTSKFSPIGSPLSSSKTPLIWQADKSTSCTCPRPDELFCTEKDDISKLRPVLRDIALLHYYVEQSLSAVTDRSMSLNKTPNDDFWSLIMKELFINHDIGANKSTLVAAQNFRDMRCFIKIFDPSVFVAILIPRLDSVVKGLCKLDHSNGVINDSSFDRMGLMMFECQRQDSASSYTNTLTYDQIKVLPIDPLSSKEWLESLRSTLRPQLARGYFSSTLMDQKLSDRTLRLTQDVAQVYSRSFVKSIFTCLLHGRAIDSEDFEKVLEICDESNIDIDLTGYLNVQTLLKRSSRTSEEELVSTNQRFNSVLGHYFEPVIISNTKWTNMYCYRPPFAKVGQNLGLSLSSGEKPSNLADVVVCAQNPLFVRLDCTLRKPAKSGSGFEEITLPLRSLPVLYEGELEDGTAFNFEPEAIGSKYSPVDSADGTTATLHLVCMTLPQSEYDPPNALFSHKSSCPADSEEHHQASFLDAERKHRARLASLSQDKQEALVETEGRLTWLFTEEIMHGLLRSGPITQNVIRYIEARLKKKNSFVDFPTSTLIPLAFVKNQKDSRRMFFEELEKNNNTPYRLVRVGDCFYASDNGATSSLEIENGCSIFDGEGLNITTDHRGSTKRIGTGDEDNEQESVTSEDDEEQGSSDEFRQGLGISILETETPDEEDEESTIRQQEPVRPQLYWLLLIPQAQSVQIYFYTKMQESVNRSEIIRVTKAMVNEVMERTNKMSLLQYLNDTRRCSKYLLASVEDEKHTYSSYEESSEEDDILDSGGNGNNLVEILSTSGEEPTFAPPKKFLPGEFNCDIVYTKRFPLHWRLAPNAAYNKLMTDTLPPFLVKNMPGMFVCSHKNAVVYCFLSEVATSIHHGPTLPDSMNQSFLNSANNVDDSYYGANPESPYGSSLVTSNNEPEVLGTSQSRIRHHSHVYNKPSPQGSIGSDRQQFSPRNSPSLTDTGGASASSPAAGLRKQPSARHYEGRELVLDVYGVEVDYYIIDGLVEMIDSRITSEITLKEVQQFLVRNPNSKLSRADIDFILPVDKEPLIRHQLIIPSLIENTVQFLKIFRKNVLSGSSLHPIHSNYLPGIIKRHHDKRYSNYDYTMNGSRVLEEQSQRIPTEEWSCLDFAFYYNYLNRAPGMYLPLEQKIGEGVAGVCLSVLNEEELAYNRIISNYPSTNGEHGKFNMDALKTCLNSDMDRTDCGEKLRVAIDIWSHCKIDTNQIYQYIYKAFRQSVCDYIIENTVSCMANAKQDHEDFKSLAKLLLFAMKKAAEWESSTVRQISKQIQLAPWYFDGIILQLKSDLTDIHLSLDPFVARAVLSSELSSIYGMSDHQVDENIEYKVYVPGFCHTEADSSDLALHDKEGSSTKRLTSLVSRDPPLDITKPKEQQQVQRYTQNKKKLVEVETFNNINYRYLVISGLPELHSKYIPSSTPGIRRSSTEGGDQGVCRPNNSRNMYFANSGSAISPIGEEDYQQSNYNLRREDTASLHSRQESLASSISKALPGYMSKQKANDFKEVSHQHSFVLFTLDSFQISIHAYNCSDQFIDHIHHTTFRNVIQQETRHMGLNNILHQKLGLFHHSDTMINILSRKQEPDTNTTTAPVLIPATPLQHNALTQVQLANNSSSRTPMSPNLVNTIGRLVQIDSSSSIPSLESLSNDRKSKGSTIVADFENLQLLVKNTFDYKHRSLRKSYPLSVLDIYDNAKLCKSTASKSHPPGFTDTVFTAVREADANTVLRDMYADSTENNKNWYDKDYLLRHGEPYLDMYLARSKPLAAHEKAFKVYTKWADHYYGPGHTKTTDEMMTVDELKQILKASRLLHFCRTPLIFCESTTTTNSAPSERSSASLLVGGSGFKKLFNKPTVSKSPEITAWYETLSSGFMREYASYLESIGMHLIVYGPSNDQPDEIEAYLSRFTIAEDYSVDSPVVYLLQVFEGGSIMCEVRLTGAFVSVTLYTLHRRYGRLQHSPFSRQQRKEIGRENFQNFMGECDQFKQRIHVNSFVFDFHLRYIQRSLDDMDSLPPNLNLLSIIKNTVSVYDRPAIYSRNRIIHGTYEFTVEDSSKELIPWIMNTGHKMGLKTLKADKMPVACFVSSDDFSFDNRINSNLVVDSENAPFRYTLILCPAEKFANDQWRGTVGVHRQGSFDMIGSNSAQKLVGRIIGGPESRDGENYSRSISLQYFVLVTYRGMDRCYSSDRCQRAWSEVLKDKPKRYANFLDEVLSPETFKLNDVFQSAKYKMDDIIKKALHFFHREADWNTLYEIVRPNLSKESPEYLIQLASRFCPIDLGQVDKAFDRFLQLKGINWHDALDNMKTFYMMTSGDIYIRDTRHVLLFIPNAATPAFFHFVYTPGEKCVVSINTKEDRKEPHVLMEEERNHISNLATSLSYYIWKRIQYC